MMKSKTQWDKIGFFPHVGIGLPLSALHSQKSCGIGEFYDLCPLITWCSSLKIDIIQLLPLNDSGADPSPYNALSSLALSPIYLSLHKLPSLSPELEQKIMELAVLNSAERVSFQTVLTRKMHLLSLYFEENKESLLCNPSFISFKRENSWLEPYALFKVLQKQFEQAPLSSWPDEVKYITQDALQTLYKEHEKEAHFYEVLQYLCFTQLSFIKKQANAQGVFLKGDLPILISPNSVDVWTKPELFNLDLSVGAPPDLYAPEGQDWGFPSFHREAMKKHDFAWWKTRLQYASHFYDLYRIDHVVGLFRLWCIPRGEIAQKGFFVPKDENLWGPHGKELLEFFLENCPMLPIAEDLGVIPNQVRPLLADLGIAGTKVMRWERNWTTDLQFIDPQLYPPFSLTCVSTHDSPTLEQWWKEFPEEVAVYIKQKNWPYNAKISQEQRRVILKESLTSASIFHINLFSEYLALIPELVWENPDMERVNIPGIILPTNWTYKCRKSIEEICAHVGLHIEMKNLLSS
jgi:4-alpha-glucanotransferase